MSKYLIWCFSGDTRTERKASSEKEAQRIFKKAVESGQYTSVALRKVKSTHSHLINSWSCEEYCLGALGTNLTEADATKILILKREEPNTYYICKVLGDDKDYYVIFNESDNTNIFSPAEMETALKSNNADNLPVYMYMLREYEEPLPAEAILDICSWDELVELQKGSFVEWYVQNNSFSYDKDEVEKFVFAVTFTKGQLLFSVNVPLNSHRFMIEEKIISELERFEPFKAVQKEEEMSEVLKAHGITINDNHPVISSVIESICNCEGWHYEPLAFVREVSEW